jgi:uncharacterized protein
VGCREDGEQTELERFVVVEPEGLILDLRRRAPGRGLWVHPRRACVARAAEGGFSRAMQEQVDSPPASELLELLADGVAVRLRERVGDALRAGAIVAGQSLVLEAMKANEVRLLVLACDAGASTAKKFRSNAERKELALIEPFSGEELGAMTGREFVSVLGVKGSEFSESLQREEKRWRALKPPTVEPDRLLE